MDGVLAILIIPLLLAGLILVILNMLDVNISLTQEEDDSSKLDEHKASVAHTDMLNKSHNSSIGAHTNFDDKYMSSSAVKALIDETNTSSSHKELIGSLVSSSINSTILELGEAALTSSLNAHNASTSAHNLNNYSDLGNKLNTLESVLNSHVHSDHDTVIDADEVSTSFAIPSKYNWSPISV